VSSGTLETTVLYTVEATFDTNSPTAPDDTTRFATSEVTVDFGEGGAAGFEVPGDEDPSDDDGGGDDDNGNGPPSPGPTPTPNQPPTVGDIALTVSENASEGTEVGEVTLNDPDGTVTDVTITAGNRDLDEDGQPAFEIDNTGQITVNDPGELQNTLDPANAPFDLTVQVTDNDGETASASVRVNVVPAPGDDEVLLFETNADGDPVSVKGEFSGDGAIQEAIDAAGDSGDLIRVGPGEYNEVSVVDGSTNGDQIGLEIHPDNLTIQGVDASGNVITDSSDVEATVISGSQSGWGTNFWVRGEGVTIQGLELLGVAEDGADGDVNKVLEVQADDRTDVNGDNFSLKGSIVGVAEGAAQADQSKSYSAVYIGGQDVSDYEIDGNVLYGGLAINNGAQGGTVTNNAFEDHYGILIQGQIDGIPWLNEETGAPNTVGGNRFSEDLAYFLYEYEETVGDIQVDSAYVDNFLNDNTVGGNPELRDGQLKGYDAEFAIVDNVRTLVVDDDFASDDEPALEFTTIQAALAAASGGDRIEVRDGTYTGDLTIDKDVTLLGANQGVAADGARGAESVIAGNIDVTADGASIDGFQIEGVFNGGGTTFLDVDASEVTFENNVVSIDSPTDSGGTGANFTGENNQITQNSFTWETILADRGDNFLFIGEGSDGTTVDQNTINAGRFGANFATGETITMAGNTIDFVAANNPFGSGGTFPGDYIFTGGSDPFGGNLAGVTTTSAGATGTEGQLAYEVTGNNNEWYFLGEQDAVDFALANAADRSVTDLSTGDFIVADGMSIQAAVDDASAGDTIIVGAGTFTEDLTINKDVTLLGANQGVAADDGGRGAESVIAGNVDVTADGASINGFQIDGVFNGGGTTFLDVDANDMTFANNIVSIDGGNGGVSAAFAGTNNTIEDNSFAFEGTLENRGDVFLAIGAGSDGTLVADNAISGGRFNAAFAANDVVTLEDNEIDFIEADDLYSTGGMFPGDFIFTSGDMTGSLDGVETTLAGGSDPFDPANDNLQYEVETSSNTWYFTDQSDAADYAGTKMGPVTVNDLGEIA
jgi:hypothetical protein